MTLYTKIVIIRVVNFATSKNLPFNSTGFPYHKIHKYILTSPDGKSLNQIYHILIERCRLSSILDVRSTRAADFDAEHYLFAAKIRDRLAVNKLRSQRFHMERLNLKKLNDVKLKRSITLWSQIGFKIWRIWMLR
jgi:hypothetical protein